MKFWITLAILCVANLAWGQYGIKYLQVEDTLSTVATVSDTTVLSAQFALKAPLASPTFTGTATMANMKWGATGYSTSFFACGIDTFTLQVQTDTVTVANVTAGAKIFWTPYGTSLDSTAVSGNVNAGARIISTGANGQIVVRRLNTSGTNSLIYSWMVIN